MLFCNFAQLLIFSLCRREKIFRKVEFPEILFSGKSASLKVVFLIMLEVETSVLLSATAEELSSRGLFTLFDSRKYKKFKID